MPQQPDEGALWVQEYQKQINPDRHKDGSHTVTLRLSNAVYERLTIAMYNNRSPRPHDTVGGYIKWLIETQFLRQR